MKILILANNDIGLYKFRRELIEKLIEDNEVYLCLPDGDFISNLKKLGCEYIDCQLLNRRGTNPIEDARLIIFYRNLIRKIRPDTVLTYTIKPNIYGGMVCASYNIPYIANITGLGSSIENPGMLRKISLFLYKYGLRNAKKVFFQNSENKDFMLEHNIVQGAYDILPGSGVNLEQYKILPYPKGETIDFILAARVMKEKGIDQFLAAAEKIRKIHPETRFHICGFCEQNYEEKIAELERKGIIIYHGFVPDMIPMYEMASCIIHPTYYPEGISNVLLESSASARPIITTDRAGCREVIDEGVNGYIVKQKDSQDLIKKIEKFIALPWEDKRQMGLNGRIKVGKEFDRQIVIQKYLKELSRIE